MEVVQEELVVQVVLEALFEVMLFLVVLFGVYYFWVEEGPFF